MTERFSSLLSPGVRVLLAVLLPLAGGTILSFLGARSVGFDPENQQANTLMLAGMALTSWYIGWRWYGLPELGVRGGRPLYAGIGFAALGWLAFLLVRFLTVEVSTLGGGDGARTFIFILLFEAFCVQVWTYGLFFRTVAEWRGPLTAAVTSGLLFAAVAFIFFQESFSPSASSLLFFAAWGVLYGIIRLRTGSFLGPVIIQALQSWTSWQVMVPMMPVNPTESDICSGSASVRDTDPVVLCCTWSW